MFNLVNVETDERFDQFPYTVRCSDVGVVGDFYPDFECDTFKSFSRFQVPFNDEYVLGKSDDLYVSDYAYKSLLEHYQNNWKVNSTVNNNDIAE
ncbi:MAG: hypothetical protein J6I97_05920 [Agathobacter sp.]|nr:hypothetical protein [Agathobacter sp.]